MGICLLKSNIDVFLCDIIYLLAQVFIVSMAQFLWYDCTLKNNLSSAVYVQGSSRVSYLSEQTILMTPE